MINLKIDIRLLQTYFTRRKVYHDDHPQQIDRFRLSKPAKTRKNTCVPHVFRVCAAPVPHMRHTRSAYALELWRICAPRVPHNIYALELWRICGAAFRTCPRSLILGGVVTSNPSVTCLLGLYKHTINTVQQLHVSTGEHSSFCVLDMRWSSGAYAAQLFRICAPRVPHMRHTRSAYAPHAFRICGGAVPHMRWKFF